jgi:hypothetical protein
MWTILFAKFGIWNQLLNRTTLFNYGKRIGVVRNRNLGTRANTNAELEQQQRMDRECKAQEALLPGQLPDGALRKIYAGLDLHTVLVHPPGFARVRPPTPNPPPSPVREAASYKFATSQ